MKTLCIKCKTEPIYVKSRGLCVDCARRFYVKRTQERKGRPEPKHHQNKVRFGSEVEFIKNFFKHKNWFYHPVIFRLNGCNYEPDFYDGERNVFIEVSGTRQAFYQNREKYRLFTKNFPLINLEIRRVNGDLIPLSETEGTYHENK